MKNVDNAKPLPFYPLVMELENVLGSTVGVMELIALINRTQFDALRSDIIKTFQIGDIQKYDGNFGDEVEFGDVSDAVRCTTFSLYPQDTPMDKPISRDERKEWCLQILQAMDTSAAFYYQE